MLLRSRLGQLQGWYTRQARRRLFWRRSLDWKRDCKSEHGIRVVSELVEQCAQRYSSEDEVWHLARARKKRTQSRILQDGNQKPVVKKREWWRNFFFGGGKHLLWTLKKTWSSQSSGPATGRWSSLNWKRRSSWMLWKPPVEQKSPPRMKLASFRQNNITRAIFHIRSTRRLKASVSTSSSSSANHMTTKGSPNGAGTRPKASGRSRQLEAQSSKPKTFLILDGLFSAHDIYAELLPLHTRSRSKVSYRRIKGGYVIISKEDTFCPNSLRQKNENEMPR